MNAAVLIVATLLGQAAGDGDAAPQFAADDLGFFEKKVRPVLVQRCFECHGGGEAKKIKGGLVLASREAILTGGDSGPAAVPGKPAESLLIEAIGYGGGIEMPPAGKLSAAELAVLTEWVERRLPFTPADETAAAKRTIDIEAGKKHWAFVPAVAQRMPGWGDQRPESRGQSSEVRGRIDTFVANKLFDKGLAPSPEADRRVLARRLAFDVTGLPPTAEEMEAFAADKSPDGYERLADRYLSSPHYGERWGRYWLDLARYCDVGEQWREGEGQGWLYRDWVIAALNADMPYDRFVRMQLAADLQPAAQPADNAALGFLGLSPTYWKELKLDHKLIKQVVAEEWEERIEAISATFLGLTAACARCHDHKFDPITQHDYYALAGVLASTKLEDRPVIAAELAEPAMAARKQVKELQQEVDKLAAIKEPSDEQKKQLADLKSRIDELKKTPHYDAPLAPGVAEASIAVLPDGEHRTKIQYQPGTAVNVAMHIRGSAANEGPAVPRRYLEVLASDASETFQQGSGRLEVADAIVTDSASLAARVMVNRLWQWHFGRGLVTTPSNFGTTGDLPSHPKLLDDLAGRFIADGWELKRLQRKIVSSATFRQQSRVSGHESDGETEGQSDGGKERRADAEKEQSLHPSLSLSLGRAAAADPENVYLWRMLPRRLDVEAWRDAMLVATGEWDAAIGGPAEDLDKAESRRRTVYGRVHRRELNDLQRLHDFPDPIAHSAGRIPTTTPLAQLFALNSPFMEQRSTALAQRLICEAPAETERRVQWLTQTLFNRDATVAEFSAAGEFLAAARQDGASPDEAWRQLCHVYLESNEFLFVD